jgi:hypothetical protein
MPVSRCNLSLLWSQCAYISPNNPLNCCLLHLRHIFHTVSPNFNTTEQVFVRLCTTFGRFVYRSVFWTHLVLLLFSRCASFVFSMPPFLLITTPIVSNSFRFRSRLLCRNCLRWSLQSPARRFISWRGLSTPTRLKVLLPTSYPRCDAPQLSWALSYMSQPLQAPRRGNKSISSCVSPLQIFRLALLWPLSSQNRRLLLINLDWLMVLMFAAYLRAPYSC